MQRARALLGDGLLTSDEPLHLRQRRLLQPAFQHDRLLAYADAIVEEARALAERWRPGETADVAEEMARLAVRGITRTLFASRLRESEFDELVAAVDGVVETFDAAMVALSPLVLRLPLPRTRRFLEARRRLDRLIRALVRHRGEGAGAATGPLSLLLEGGLDENLIRDEVVTLLLAGYETVASTLTWTFYARATHPPVEQRLHQ